MYLFLIVNKTIINTSTGQKTIVTKTIQPVVAGQNNTPVKVPLVIKQTPVKTTTTISKGGIPKQVIQKVILNNVSNY